ncbi:MAG TPA: hypothetical protein VIQ51_18390 [Chryseosolibacter sp.]
MQILFISEEDQIFNFLSGLHAEAIMPTGNFDIAGMAENNSVTVICSGESVHYPAIILSIDNSYSPASDSKWLSLKFIVRRHGASVPLVPEQVQRPADA